MMQFRKSWEERVTWLFEREKRPLQAVMVAYLLDMATTQVAPLLRDMATRGILREREETTGRGTVYFVYELVADDTAEEGE